MAASPLCQSLFHSICPLTSSSLPFVGARSADKKETVVVADDDVVVGAFRKILFPFLLPGSSALIQRHLSLSLSPYLSYKYVYTQQVHSV